MKLIQSIEIKKEENCLGENLQTRGGVVTKLNDAKWRGWGRFRLLGNILPYD